ncbi:hypothetical protein D3C84_586490 [compost metagenome]
MSYIPVTFHDEHFISVLNRYDLLIGRLQHATQEYCLARSYRIKSRDSALLEQWQNDHLVLARDFLWSHTFEPATQLLAGKNFLKMQTKYQALMCKYCIQDDINSSGVAYSHRTHNFPGVTHCHLHNAKLECTCSMCGVTHFMHETSKYYTCLSQKLEPLRNISAASVADVKYSKFIYEMLCSPKRNITNKIRSKAILNKIIDLGLNRGLSKNRRTIEPYISKKLKNSALVFQAPYQNFSVHRMSIQDGAIFLFALFEKLDTYYEYTEKSSSFDFIDNDLE